MFQIFRRNADTFVLDRDFYFAVAIRRRYFQPRAFVRVFDGVDNQVLNRLTQGFFISRDSGQILRDFFFNCKTFFFY